MPGAHFNGRRAEERASAVRALEWSDAQVAVLARAEVLRAEGNGRGAEELVAVGAELPSWLPIIREGDQSSVAPRLDVARWYLALVGRTWDGEADSLVAARHFAMSRRRSMRRRDRRGVNRQAAAAVTGGTGVTLDDGTRSRAVASFRTASLLVQALDDDLAREAVAEVTRSGGWPRPSDVGRLEWDSEEGRACCYCEALLLPSEQERVKGARHQFRGKHCCKEGCASSCECSVDSGKLSGLSKMKYLLFDECIARVTYRQAGRSSGNARVARVAAFAMAGPCWPRSW